MCDPFKQNQILLLHCSKWLFISLWKSQSSNDLQFFPTLILSLLTPFYTIHWMQEYAFTTCSFVLAILSSWDSLPLDTCKDYSVISCRFVSKWYILKIVIFTIENSSMKKKCLFFFFAWFSYCRTHHQQLLHAIMPYNYLLYLLSVSLHLAITCLLLQLHGWQRPKKFV